MKSASTLSFLAFCDDLEAVVRDGVAPGEGGGGESDEETSRFASISVEGDL